MAVLTPNEIDETRQSQIVDVRTPDEFLREHIPGSQNIPLDQIGAQASAFLNQPVILSCQSGGRATQAKAILEAQGCLSVSLLDGGLQGWKAAGRTTSSLKSGISVMRQVQLIVGSMILLGTFVKPVWFLAPLAGVGLLTAGLTNTCLMASMLSKMPWNRLPDHN